MNAELTATLTRQRDEAERGTALRIASRLMTGRKDPQIVLPVAERFVAWIRDDSLPGNRDARERALMRQFGNVRDGDFADDPEGFIAAAAQYVPFITADETAA